MRNLSKSKFTQAPKDCFITNFGTTSNSGCPSFFIVAEPSVPNVEVSKMSHGEVWKQFGNLTAPL